MKWRPATIEEVVQHVQQDLAKCNSEQRVAFRKYSVPPYAAPIVRYGQRETVIVVARKDNEAMYWEDVEEGFNTSPIGSDGMILEHRCNQDELCQALGYWAPGQPSGEKLSPT